MGKLDLAKAYPEYYKVTSTPKMVHLEPLNYLTIQGNSSPEDESFLSAIEEAYAVMYAVKFYYKAQDLDFVVPKMEAFWWVEGELPFDETPRDEWHWKIMFRLPDYVSSTDFKQTIEGLKQKGKIEKSRACFEEICEGKSAQILHTGSYDEEAPTLEKLFKYVEQEGKELNGYHHEIYLSDPRKVPVEKLKTILRYAVK